MRRPIHILLILALLQITGCSTRSNPPAHQQPTSVAASAGPQASATLASPVAAVAVSVAPAGLKSSGTNKKGFQEFTNEKDQTVLVRIPGGTFQMGSNERDNEKPPHSVTLPAYLMARVPVTNAQFARFVSATRHDAGSDWKSYASKWGDQAPVVCVNRHDAMAYCTWAGLRLPTEAEREYAAGGPQSLKFPWGNAWYASYVWWSENSGLRAHPVGSKPDGASWCGCLDMAGNVWEQCSSEYRPYPYRSDDGRENPSGGGLRVLRGGSWCSDRTDRFRCADRVSNAPADRDISYGFRVARTP